MKGLFKEYKFNKTTLIIIISILIGMLIYYLFLKKFSEITGTICLIRGTIGVPCPACGISRAVISFFNGNFIEAFKYHPLFWLPIILLVSIINKRYVKRKLIFFIIIFASMYIVRMTVLFPNVEPMKFNEKAIFKIDIR